MMRTSIPIFLLFLLSAAVESQGAAPFRPVPTDPVVEPWRWQSVGELKSVGLLSIAESPDGALWFGTEEGLRRYDGRAWTNYGPADGPFGTVAQTISHDSSGFVTIGTASGIARLEAGIWEQVFPAQKGLLWDVVQIVQDQRGDLWAATAWGALHISPSDTTLYTSAEMADALRTLAPYLDPHVVALPPGATPVNAPEPGLGIQVVGGHVWSVSEANDIGLAVGDRILRVNGSTHSSQSSLQGPPGKRVELVGLRSGESDTIRVSTTYLEIEGTFSDFRVHTIAVQANQEGSEGDVWIGLERGNILRHRATQADSWKQFSSSDGLVTGNRPRILQASDGTIWTISNNLPHQGVNQNASDSGTWATHDLLALGGTNFNSSIMETRDGTLWVGGHKGLLHAYRDGQWTVYTRDVTPLESARIFHLLETSDDFIWIGNRKEAFRLDYGSPGQYIRETRL